MDEGGAFGVVFYRKGAKNARERKGVVRSSLTCALVEQRADTTARNVSALWASVNVACVYPRARTYVLLLGSDVWTLRVRIKKLAISGNVSQEQNI